MLRGPSNIMPSSTATWPRHPPCPSPASTRAAPGCIT